ncbi:uncharacterized protein TNCV_4569941 [Trichonephila clavipes]|nr:uncharacterized protein TNCV_4569941 [Trichonephila clavipes]
MWLKILLPHQHYPLAAIVGKDGKLYFRLVDVGALLGRSKVYKFAKRFDNLVIQSKDVLPAHKQYPIMTQKSKLVTPDVVFNILKAELLSWATSFAISLNAGSALVENPSSLFVENYKTSPVLHVQDTPVPNSTLACLRAEPRPSVELAECLSLPERIPTAPAELDRIPTPHAQRPAEPEKMPPAEPERPPMDMVDWSVSVNTVEVTPPLITCCDKSTQTIFPHIHVKRLDFIKRCMEQPQANKRLCIKQEPSENPVQQTVSKNMVFRVDCHRQAQTIQFGDQGLDRAGSPDSSPWIQLAQMVLDGCYGQKWPDTVFQVPDASLICLTPIHNQGRTQFGHVFHKKYLLQHLDIRNT